MLPTTLNITLHYIILFKFFEIFYLVCNYLVCNYIKLKSFILVSNYLVCNFFTKEESTADILVSEQVGVAVVSLRWSSRFASDHLVGVAGC